MATHIKHTQTNMLVHYSLVQGFACSSNYYENKIFHLNNSLRFVRTFVIFFVHFKNLNVKHNKIRLSGKTFLKLITCISENIKFMSNSHLNLLSISSVIIII